MKNLKILIATLILSLLLASCFNNNNEEEDNVTKAKDEILGNNNSENNDNDQDDNSNSTWEINQTEWSWWLDNSQKYEEAENTESNTQRYRVNYLTDERFLSLDSLEWENFSWLEVELTWNTLVDSVDKIVVKFSNPDSNYPDDNYTLQTFESGWSEFTYRAFAEYETLDYWVNTYILEAYSWDTVSKLEVIINISDSEDENTDNSTSSNNSTVSSQSFDLNVENLPSSSEFWNPKAIWNGSITYSDIKWLEIKKIWENAIELESDSVTNFLIDNWTGWFYWNTLREISWDKWISFYVLRLEWENYFYEKHYYLDNWIYWVITLDRWTWIDQEGLKDANTELAWNNDEFEITEITDELFVEILNQ